MPILMEEGNLCQKFVVSLSHNSLKTHTLYKHKLKLYINFISINWKLYSYISWSSLKINKNTQLNAYVAK